MSIVADWFANRNNQIMWGGLVIFMLVFAGYFGWLAANQEVLDEAALGSSASLDWEVVFHEITETGSETLDLDDGETGSIDLDIMPPEGHMLASITVDVEFAETDEIAVGLCDEVSSEVVTTQLTPGWDETNSHLSDTSDDCNADGPVYTLVMSVVPAYNGIDHTAINQSLDDVRALYDDADAGQGTFTVEATVSVNTLPGPNLFFESGEDVQLSWTVRYFSVDITRDQATTDSEA